MQHPQYRTSTMNKQQSGEDCLTLSLEFSINMELEDVIMTNLERDYFENETLEYNPNDWHPRCVDRSSNFPLTPNIGEFLIDALFVAPTPGSVQKFSPVMKSQNNYAARMLPTTATIAKFSPVKASKYVAAAEKALQYTGKTLAESDTVLPRSLIQWSNDVPMAHPVSQLEYRAMAPELMFGATWMKPSETIAVLIKEVITLITDVEHGTFTPDHSGVSKVCPHDSYNKTAIASVRNTKPLEFYPATSPENETLPCKAKINSNGVSKAQSTVPSIATVCYVNKKPPRKSVHTLKKRMLFPTTSSGPSIKKRTTFTSSINNNTGSGGHHHTYVPLPASTHYYSGLNATPQYSVATSRNVLSNAGNVSSTMQPAARTPDQHLCLQDLDVVVPVAGIMQKQQLQQPQEYGLNQAPGCHVTKEDFNVPASKAALFNVGNAQKVLAARRVSID